MHFNVGSSDLFVHWYYGDGQYAIYTSKQNSNHIIKITNNSSKILQQDMEYIFTKFYTSYKSRSKKQ